MKFKSDLDQIIERIRKVEDNLKYLLERKENIDKLVHKKLFGISFLVFKDTASLLYEQEELENIIIYLEDYRDVLLEEQTEINNHLTI